ncbi:7TM-DISM domain-containing protein [Oligoflexus tunisiensis]|uniref:7TM-DISM domain-containing protein n=1 Tax=Oligoflexus tunisiensis TaxID=708132 RepID=UPI000AA153D2|nr:7TM-DISM domain-containing protein [Oligoflexus tunisiensis]
MRWKLCKSLQFCLLMGSLWFLTSGCDHEQLYDLQGSKTYTLMPEGLDEPLSFEAMKQNENFLPPNRIDHLDAFQAVWLRYEVPAEALDQRSVLMLGFCGNVDKVYWGERMLADFQLKSNFNLELNRNNKPYFLLPMDQGPQPLYFRILRSHRTAFQLDCREVRIGNEVTVVRRFATFQAFETLTSMVMLFLCAISLMVWLFKMQRTILLFGLFSGSVGATFFAVSHPVHFALPGIPWLLHVWHFAVMIAPAAFMFFFYHVLPTPIPTLRVLAWVNIVPTLVGVALFASGYDQHLERLRILFFQFLGPQLIVVAILCLPLLIRAPSPAPILTLGLIVLFLGTAVDIASLLLGWPFFEATCLALIFFMGTLITYLIQIYIDRERSLEVERTRSLEEYSLKLAEEVELRSQVLQVKTEELEQSNFDLEEKNILLSISHKRLEDLIGQKDALLKKVAEISSDILPSLTDGLKQLYEQRNKTALQNLSIEVHKIASQLEPVARLHSTSEALRSRRIWLLEPEKQLLMVTKMALGGSRVDIRSFMKPDEFTEAMSQEQPDLTVISTDFTGIPSLVHRQFPSVATVLTTRHELSQHIDLLAENPGLCHVIYQDDEERALTQKNLLVTVTKILSNDIFGLEKYLNWGVDVKEYIITSSQNRAQYLEVVESELTKAGIMTSHIRNATMITDEILMNAIYDAPVDRKTGLSKYNHLSRRVAVELEPTEYGKLRFAFDGSTIALSVDDPFGALKRETITRYLKSCFDGHFGKINEHEGKGGGGMGLFQIISTADLMITNIKPGERTEIIALINVIGKTQVRKRHGSFHYFVER